MKFTLIRNKTNPKSETKFSLKVSSLIVSLTPLETLKTSTLGFLQYRWLTSTALFSALTNPIPILLTPCLCASVRRLISAGGVSYAPSRVIL